MPVAARDLESALLRKGFRNDRNTSDKIFYLWHNGKKTSVWTKLSMGRGEDLRDKLLGIIKRQLRFDSTHQLNDFVKCPLTLEQYLQLLIAKGVIRD